MNVHAHAQVYNQCARPCCTSRREEIYYRLMPVVLLQCVF